MKEKLLGCEIGLMVVGTQLDNVLDTSDKKILCYKNCLCFKLCVVW